MSACQIVPILTLLVLCIYAWDTRQIKRASILQVDLSNRPYLTFEHESDEVLDAAIRAGYAEVTSGEPSSAVHIKGRDVRFINIGRGPAIDIQYTFVHESHRVTQTVPHILAGDGFTPPITGIPEVEGETTLEIRYKSLAGDNYLTSVVLETDGHHVHVKTFRFRSGSDSSSGIA